MNFVTQCALVRAVLIRDKLSVICVHIPTVVSECKDYGLLQCDSL